MNNKIKGNQDGTIDVINKTMTVTGILNGTISIEIDGKKWNIERWGEYWLLKTNLFKVTCVSFTAYTTDIIWQQ